MNFSILQTETGLSFKDPWTFAKYCLTLFQKHNFNQQSRKVMLQFTVSIVNAIKLQINNTSKNKSIKNYLEIRMIIVNIYWMFTTYLQCAEIFVLIGLLNPHKIFKQILLLLPFCRSISLWQERDYAYKMCPVTQIITYRCDFKPSSLITVHVFNHFIILPLLSSSGVKEIIKSILTLEEKMIIQTNLKSES